MILRALCHRGLAILALAAILGGTAFIPQTVRAQESPAGSSTEVGPNGTIDSLAVGAGRTTLPADLFPEEFVGDDVRVALFAYALADQPASGRFSITHTEPDGALVAELRADVECMRTEGDYAVVAGRITDADAPGIPQGAPEVGGVAAVVVEDGGRSGDTMVWSFGGADEELNCAAIPALTAVPVEQGAFLVSG